ncbi:hypothetical protein GQ42DRAFT_143205 [Ramicandelaber brevisporus]|nr:hypothetical protein GQ42DRAFT_143205 [Ramicandelaber brevisporus]
MTSVIVVVVGCMGAVVLIGVVAMKLFVLWHRYPVEERERLVMEATVQYALDVRHRLRLESRRQLREALPKPVKPTLSDIPSVVLDESNIQPIITRSATTVLPPSTTPGNTNSHDNLHGDDNDNDNGDNHNNHDSDDDDDSKRYANPLAHVRSLAGINKDIEPAHPLQGTICHECCSICIDEFIVGSTVRILPGCHHVFHTDCIDPWLCTASALCPLCKSDTRTPTEIEDYETQLAIAKVNETFPDSNRTVNIQVAEYFELTIDDFSIDRLGCIIKQGRPVLIQAVYAHNQSPAVSFTTSVFIRDDDGATNVNNGIRRRALNMILGVEKVHVTVGLPTRHGNTTTRGRTAALPPMNTALTLPSSALVNVLQF